MSKGKYTSSESASQQQFFAGIGIGREHRILLVRIRCTTARRTAGEPQKLSIFSIPRLRSGQAWPRAGGAADAKDMPMPRLKKGQPAGIWNPSTPRFLSGQASLATPFSTAEAAEVAERILFIFPVSAFPACSAVDLLRRRDRFQFRLPSLLHLVM